MDCLNLNSPSSSNRIVGKDEENMKDTPIKLLDDEILKNTHMKDAKELDTIFKLTDLSCPISALGYLDRIFLNIEKNGLSYSHRLSLIYTKCCSRRKNVVTSIKTTCRDIYFINFFNIDIEEYMDKYFVKKETFGEREKHEEILCNYLSCVYNFIYQDNYYMDLIDIPKLQSLLKLMFKKSIFQDSKLDHLIRLIWVLLTHNTDKSGLVNNGVETEMPMVSDTKNRIFIKSGLIKCVDKFVPDVISDPANNELLKILFGIIVNYPEKSYIKNKKFATKLNKYLEYNISSKNENFNVLCTLYLGISPKFIKDKNSIFELSHDTIKTLCQELDHLPNSKIDNIEFIKVKYLMFTVISVLIVHCKTNRKIRKIVSYYVLPRRYISDVILNLPEAGNDTASKLIKSLSSTEELISMICGELCFVLCKENRDILTKRVGYGNVCGFYMNYSFINGSKYNDVKGDYSSDEDDDDNLGSFINDLEIKENSKSSKNILKSSTGKKLTPLQAKSINYLKEHGEYNNITGSYSLTNDPFQSMTDDEKERESRKLACMIQDLAKSKIFQPVLQNPDGSTDPLSMNGSAINSALRTVSGLKNWDDRSDDDDDDEN